LQDSVFIEMLAKPFATRVTTTTRARYVQHGLGRKTSFSRRGSISAAGNDPKPRILQMNSEGLTAQLHNCRQASDSQLLTSWVNPEQEARTCHLCPRVVGMVSGESVSWAIRGWVFVRRRGSIYWSLRFTNFHSRDLHLRPSRRFHTPVCMLAL